MAKVQPRPGQNQKTYREIDRLKALQPERQTLFESARAVLQQVQFRKKPRQSAAVQLAGKQAAGTAVAPRKEEGKRAKSSVPETERAEREVRPLNAR